MNCLSDKMSLCLQYFKKYHFYSSYLQIYLFWTGYFPDPLRLTTGVRMRVPPTTRCTIKFVVAMGGGWMGTIHLAGCNLIFVFILSSVAAAARSTTERFLPRDGADVGGGETNRSQFSAWTNSGRDSPHQHPVSARRRLTGKDKFNSDVNLYLCTRV